MRKIIVSFSISLFLLFGVNSNVISQENENCKVLLESISESYKGDCKKGLAHGNGIAKGIDTYEGKFKKGYPQGHGVYTWENRDVYDGNWKEGKRDGKGKMYYKSINEDSVLNAYWIDDKFIKEIVEPPYEISFKTSNITRVSFVEENSERGDIQIIIMKGGIATKADALNYTDIMGNSGVVTRRSSYMGIEQVLFPFEGQVKFKASSGVTVYDYSLMFKITKAGSWKVTIYI